MPWQYSRALFSARASLHAVLTRDVRALAKWDELLAQGRPVVGLSGADAHEGTRLLGRRLDPYEVFMGISIMGVVMMAGSFSLVDIVEAQKGLWFFVPQIAGFIVFMIAGIAESHRLPFDLPEAESELIAGFHSEYSGMKFGMFFVGEYIGITTVSALMVTLFFGGWMGPVLPPIAWFVIKTMGFICFFILLRGSLPRPRYDQLMGLAWKWLLPLSLANVMGTAAYVLLRGGF